MNVDFAKMEEKIKTQLGVTPPEIKQLGAQTFRIKSETPNYSLQCRVCSALFSPNYKECPNCTK